MRILYVGMMYDYGLPERGLSFEHWNFYHSLKSMGHDVLYFDFGSLFRELGRQEMNRRLWSLVEAEKPEILFSIMFQEELERDVVRRISFETDTVTVNWFCDDHWRFESFSRRWAPCFNWVVTTAQSAIPEYEAIGYDHVIKSQWGFNHFLCQKLDLPSIHDVAFVGQPHGDRREIISSLREAGINVAAWGYGWESGRLDQQDLIRVLNQSRINLNLSNASSTGAASPLPRPLAQVRSLAGRALGHFGPGRRIRALLKANLEARAAKVVFPEQIKARNFEIPGCGGFQLSGPAENIEEYFLPDKEIVIYTSLEDLVEKVRYYLAHPEARSAIADAGYARAIREHTYEQRLGTIFSIIRSGK